MGRFDAGKWRFGEYSFFMEFDTGGDPDYPYTLWIYEHGNPLVINKSNKQREIQLRREFPKDYNKIHVKNFCNKFANDNIYRNQFINKFAEAR